VTDGGLNGSHRLNYIYPIGGVDERFEVKQLHGDVVESNPPHRGHMVHELLGGFGGSSQQTGGLAKLVYKGSKDERRNTGKGQNRRKQGSPRTTTTYLIRLAPT